MVNKKEEPILDPIEADHQQQVIEKLRMIFDQHLSDPKGLKTEPERRRVKGDERAWSAIYMRFSELELSPQLLDFINETGINKHTDAYLLKFKKITRSRKFERRIESNYEMAIFVPFSQIRKLPEDEVLVDLKIKIDPAICDFEFSETGRRVSGRLWNRRVNPLDRRLGLTDQLIDAANEGLERGIETMKLQSVGFGYDSEPM